MNQRTGSYPFMNIAADFGLDYGDVLCYAERVRENVRKKPNTTYVYSQPAIRRIMSQLTWQSFGRMKEQIHVTVRSYQARLGNIEGDTSA